MPASSHIRSCNYGTMNGKVKDISAGRKAKQSGNVLVIRNLLSVVWNSYEEYEKVLISSRYDVVA